MYATYLLLTWWWWAEQLQLTRAAPISDQNLSSLFLNEFVDSWLCFNHVLWQRVQTITDSDTEERFPDGLGTSWNVNFHRVTFEAIYTSGAIWKNNWLKNWLSTRSFPVKILRTFQLNLHAVFVVGVDKFPGPSIFPHMWRIGGRSVSLPWVMRGTGCRGPLRCQRGVTATIPCFCHDSALDLCYTIRSIESAELSWSAYVFFSGCDWSL